MSVKLLLLNERYSDLTDPISIKDLPSLEIYTVKHVVHMLGINVGTVYQLLRDGAIPAKRLGRRWVIPRKRFHEWLDGLEQGKV